MIERAYAGVRALVTSSHSLIVVGKREAGKEEGCNREVRVLRSKTTEKQVY